MIVVMQMVGFVAALLNYWATCHLRSVKILCKQRYLGLQPLPWRAHVIAFNEIDYTY